MTEKGWHAYAITLRAVVMTACLCLPLQGHHRVMGAISSQDDHSRYCITAGEARAHLQRCFPKRQIIQCGFQPSRPNDLLFISGGHYFVGSNGEYWFYNLTSGDLQCYADTGHINAWTDYCRHSKRAERNHLAELNRAKAIAWAEKSLRLWLPDWKKHKLVASWFPPLHTMLFFQERLPCGAANNGYCADVFWDARTGRPLRVHMRYHYASPRIPLVARIDQATATKLAEEVVERKLGARWHMRIDQYEPYLKCIGMNFQLETDGLGIQRLLYGFRFAYWLGDKGMTPEEYEAILQQTKKLPDTELMPRVDIAVDAMDGEVIPFTPMVAEEIDRLKITPILYIDNSRAFLNYMPRIENGEPYFYIGYLDDTPLWHGKISNGSSDRFSITYAGRKAAVAPEGVEIRDGNRVIHHGKPPILYKGKTYLHFRDIAALTGDAIRWNPKTERLDISTTANP